MTPVHVVLVNTQYPRNLGAAARACGNMGAGKLISVAPECETDHVEARQGAAGAQKHLEELSVYKNIEEFISSEPDGIRIAMTARSGKNRPNFLLPQLLKEFETQNQDGSFQENTPIYLMFGPEDDGLSTEQLEACQYSASLPIYGEFKSLNLAHAVQLALYIVQSWRESMDFTSTTDSKREVVDLHSGPLVKAWLLELGFDLSSPRVNAAKILTNLLDRSLPSAKEKEIFEKVVQQSLRKLREGNKEDGTTV